MYVLTVKYDKQYFTTQKYSEKVDLGRSHHHILALPVIIRLAILGDFYGVVAVLVGALFIPVTAITLGIATMGSKLFEVLFAMTIYASFNKIPFLDLIGSIEASRSLGMAYYFFGISLVLIVLAFILRKRHLIRI